MKYKIIYSQAACTSCYRCALTCSNAYEKGFQPSRARIRVSARHRVFSVTFTDNCNQCGLCADACLFGALSKIPISEADK